MILEIFTILQILYDLKDFANILSLRIRKSHFQNVKMVHCLLCLRICPFAKIHFPSKNTESEYLGQSFKKTAFANWELRPWLWQTCLESKLPNQTYPTHFNSSAKCTPWIFKTSLNSYGCHFPKIKGYVQIKIVTTTFAIQSFISKCFLKTPAFGFNLQNILKYFNFLVNELYNGQVRRHNPGDGSERSEKGLCTHWIIEKYPRPPFKPLFPL